MMGQRDETRRCQGNRVSKSYRFAEILSNFVTALYFAPAKPDNMREFKPKGGRLRYFSNSNGANRGGPRQKQGNESRSKSSAIVR